MMIRIPPARYASLRPLFDGLQYNLAVNSILRECTPGRVYADPASLPQTGLLWDGQATLFLAGEPLTGERFAALRDLIAGEIFPAAENQGIDGLALHYYPLAWEARIESGWTDLAIERTSRRFYRFNQPKINWRRELPEGLQMRPIDTELLRRGDLGNLPLLARQVESCWPSLEKFMEVGTGYCLLDAAAARSWCFARYACQAEIELWTETAPAFRGRGYAALVTAACVDFCLAEGRILHWHCWEDDPACLALAIRAGFWQPARYPVYRLSSPDF